MSVCSLGRRRGPASRQDRRVDSIEGAPVIRTTVSARRSKLSTTTELPYLHDLIGGLRRCVNSLKARYDDSPAMRRIVIDADRILSDVELLETDVSELDLARATVQQSGEKMAIPDTQYDSDFWRDVDDEGVGGHNRA